jgi:hypothetical protein
MLRSTDLLLSMSIFPESSLFGFPLEIINSLVIIIVGKNECRLEHVMNWMNLFIDMHFQIIFQRRVNEQSRLNLLKP